MADTQQAMTAPPVLPVGRFALLKSTSGWLRVLGFTRLNQVVEREDTASIRGMVKAVPHLVRILE